MTYCIITIFKYTIYEKGKKRRNNENMKRGKIMTYLGLYIGVGGGVSIYSWEKFWYLHSDKVGGSGACSSENFLKWCNLERLENILLKFCKKNCKNIFFYIKIINNVLYCAHYI